MCGRCRLEYELSPDSVIDWDEVHRATDRLEMTRDLRELERGMAGIRELTLPEQPTPGESELTFTYNGLTLNAPDWRQGYMVIEIDRPWL